MNMNIIIACGTFRIPPELYAARWHVLDAGRCGMQQLTIPTSLFPHLSHKLAFTNTYRCHHLRLRPGSARGDASGATQQCDRRILVDRIGRLERPQSGVGWQRTGGKEEMGEAFCSVGLCKSRLAGAYLNASHKHYTNTMRYANSALQTLRQHARTHTHNPTIYNYYPACG